MADINKILKLKSDVPEGISGDYKIEKFIVSEQAARFHNMRESINGRGRDIEAGEYKKLTKNHSIIMSDTPAEKYDCLDLLVRAKGNLLFNGLGLGWTVEACLQIKDVAHITIIEISQDIISLVKPYLESVKKYKNRFEIVMEDAFNYNPNGEKYDVVWHDIWNEICGDNWEQMKRLKRKYQHKTIWQKCWCEEETRAKR